MTLVLAAALGLISSSVQAQDTQCERCLTFVPVAELSSANATVVPSMAQSVVRMPGRGFLVSHLFTAGPEIVVYNPGGDFLRLYGKAGQGPGEFRASPRLYGGPRNTVWAAEGDRISRLDARLRHLETRRIGQPMFGETAVALPNGSMVVCRSIVAASGSFFSVTQLDSVGNVLEELEAQSDRYVSTAIAPAASGGFWALKANEVMLRRYSEAGEVLQTVPIVIGSFEPWEGEALARARRGGEPPPPGHVALLDVGNDLIVVLTVVPDAYWTAIASSGFFQPSETDANQIYDTSVALVDLRAGRSIGVKRVPEYLHVVGGASDLVFVTRPDSVGHVTTTILRVQAGRP